MDAPQTAPPPQSETGGHAYVLVERIGEGPNGTVWRGWRRSTSGIDRPVAVKMVDTAADARDLLEGIAVDAAALARLRHHAVATVEDVLVFEGYPAVVSELVDGVDLGALLGAGALSPRATAELLHDLLGALEAAHTGLADTEGRTRAVLHLNLKLGNVRITRWGEVKLTDFVLGEGQDLLHRAGNPGYTAPEAWTRGVGTAADVFAAGVIGWECRTGRRFGVIERSPEAMNRQVSDAFDTLWGDPLTPLLRRLLAWEPEARPTAAQARRELAALAREQHGPSLRDHLDHRLGGRPEPEAGRTGVYRMIAPAEPGFAIDPDAQTSILMVGTPDPSEVGEEEVPSPPPARGRGDSGGASSWIALLLVMVAGFLFAVCLALVGLLLFTRG